MANRDHPARRILLLGTTGTIVRATAAAQAAGVGQFVLMSVICVQTPPLAFQHSKLAFERELMASGVRWSIARPTAFFKSLSGQIGRLHRGKPYLQFGDSRLTACKPISDRDLGDYLADCLDDPEKQYRILPIGGSAPTITPLEQGDKRFELIGRTPRFKRVPVAPMVGIIGVLGTLGRIEPCLAAKVELARIGRHHATESMLALDPATGRYVANATPSTGSDTLFGLYARAIRDPSLVERGDHAVF